MRCCCFALRAETELRLAKRKQLSHRACSILTFEAGFGRLVHTLSVEYNFFLTIGLFE